ncbi:MAG: DNA repair protein RadA, partial [Clostridiales Family XIII bacterium]|nr:DNA repair protein RadA [Clostridiales Family XIII bacterium]
MAGKKDTIFVCAECGYESPKWMGQCICGAWNSFYEERAQARSKAGAGKASGGGTVRRGGADGAFSGPGRPVPLRTVASGQADRIDTNIGELNRVLGGGIAKGTLTLIAGEPGIGKSTLILQAAIGLARQELTVLYVSGEESGEQIRMRADRVTNDIPGRVLMLAETNIDAIADTVAELHPDFLIIDSIQTMYTDEITSAAGGVSQIRVCTDVLMHIGKQRGIPVFIVAHITKAGELAGPKIIEHLVDCVLSFSGDKSRDLRLLTASKNRFGTTSEIGAFEMRENGLAEITDLSGALLDGFSGQTEGTIATAAYEGTRPLLMELQALTAHTNAGFPARTSLGADRARLGMILAVLEKKAGLNLSSFDVYVNVVGGVRPEGTSIDLAAALAVWSSAKGIAIPAGTIAIGEIGLAGEIRGVRHADRIAAEAVKLGFTRLILPEKNIKMKTPQGLRLCGAATLQEAIAALL